MKIVINTVYGGFSLSAKAIKRLAELRGQECYFFKNEDNRFEQITIEQAQKDMFFYAATTPTLTNETYARVSLDGHPADRADKQLIQVVEELDKEAAGKFAELSIVEIPDDVSYEIEDYDGKEHVAESHRTWY